MTKSDSLMETLRTELEDYLFYDGKFREVFLTTRTTTDPNGLSLAEIVSSALADKAVSIIRQHEAEQPQDVVERVANAIAVNRARRSETFKDKQHFSFGFIAPIDEDLADAQAAIVAMGDAAIRKDAGGAGETAEGAVGAFYTSPAIEQKITDALRLFVELSQMAFMQFYPETDMRKWSDLVNKEALATAKKGLAAWNTRSEIQVVDDEKIKTLIFNTITRAELGLILSNRNYLMNIIYREIKPYLREPKRESGEQPIPDNAEVREVLTWAHNVTMCCSGLPADDSVMFPVKTFYLRVLCEVVEKLRNAKSTRTLSFLRKLNSREGGSTTS